MSIRTAENLDDCISEDFAWRKKELADIKGLILTKPLTSAKRDTFIRAGVALLYAHWEGFIKSCAQNYVEFVAMQRLTYQELTPNFVGLALKTKIDEMRRTSNADFHTEVVEFFTSHMTDRSVLPYRRAVNTKSNLSSSVFYNIMCMLGLDYSSYETKEKLLDDRLVAPRNHIAHGQYLAIDETEYIELQNHVLQMMEMFRTQITNSAVLESFRRQT